MLDKLSYAEWAGYGYVGWEGYGNLPGWAYDPPQRHDFPVLDDIADAQGRTIDYLFQPTVLARLDQNALESTAPTLTTPVFFSWMQRAVFGDVAGHARTPISLERRNLQALYESKLIALAIKPQAGAPADAQALARLELERLAASASARERTSGLDDATRAHLDTLAARARAALEGKD